MIQLENEWLSLTIEPKGAELQTLRRKDNGLDYLWKGDPSFWGKHSPVLFPIVGELKDNTYYFEGKAYTLPRHGFARDRVFEYATDSGQEALFTLQDDADTRDVYPFTFLFEVRYRLSGAVLEVCYAVHNPGAGTLFFCVGGHPAFAVPLVKGTTYEDYHLTFSQPETAGRWGLQGGLLQSTNTPFLNHQTEIALTPRLFVDDAIVLKGLQSESITLGSDKTPHGLRFRIKGWPDLGIWAAPNAPFVCIEPWQGHADSVDSDQELIHKEGVVGLPAGERWEKAWAVELF